jgi:hypothetical protein
MQKRAGALTTDCGFVKQDSLKNRTRRRTAGKPLCGIYYPKNTVLEGIPVDRPARLLAAPVRRCRSTNGNSDLRPDQYAQPVLALIALRQMEAKQAAHPLGAGYG